MAGIGFDLSKLIKEGSIHSVLGAYSTTAMMVSGPGLFIILTISSICFLYLFSSSHYLTGYQFLAMVTYLLSTSMIVSASLQYTFSRFISDRIFSKEFKLVTPNLIGALLLQLAIGIVIAVPLVFYFFSQYSLILKCEIIANFLILCLIWLSVVALTGIKAYRLIIWGFAIGYTVMFVVHYLWGKPEMTFLLFEFFLAQVILFLFLIYAILDFYPASDCIKFEFLKKENFYFTLVFSSFFYTLGFWIDKYLFWFNSATGFLIFPPLQLSPLYDLPMFISYLATIPAISAFLLKIEAKFALNFPNYMQYVFKRKTLAEINAVRDELVNAGRESVFSLLNTQSVMVVVMLLVACFMFAKLHILPIYLNLFFILLVASGLNVILWGLFNILYYLTQYRNTLYLSIIFLISNIVFTLITLKLGPYYYGLGYGLSSLLSIACALVFINRDFKNLEYYTFMMAD